jgi:excisionase family DNA binding protein
MDVVAAAGWRPPVGISYGQPMGANESKKGDIAPASSTLLTVREVSERLRVHPTTICRLVRSNQIPGFRVGSEWRFRTDTFDRTSRAPRRRIRSRLTPRVPQPHAQSAPSGRRSARVPAPARSYPPGGSTLKRP